MTFEEWTPKVMYDLVLFYGIYGEEKDGVKHTIIDTVTSYELTDWFDDYNDPIDVNSIKYCHASIPNIPAFC